VSLCCVRSYRSHPASFRPSSDLEGAALATALRNLPDHVEDISCDGRQAGEVLAEADVAVEIHADELANVG
jgi:hypothetical protein